MRFKLIALFCGILMAFLVAEAVLRGVSGKLKLEGFASTEASKPMYRISATLGYEPVPGMEGYNEHGVLDYGYSLTRRESLVRVLVLGDSVAHRRIWVEALSRQLSNFLGTGRFVEFWNAGVEGYNTMQQEAYLRQTGIHLRADMVLVQFHLNDFLPLPVVFQDSSGQTAFLPVGSALGQVSPALFRYSYLYRYWLLRWKPSQAVVDGQMRQSIAQAVLGIQELCLQNGMSLVFVIFPLFKERSAYTENENQAYHWILDIVEEARIDYLDLLPNFPQDASIHQLRETPEDFWHPNKEGHLRIAEEIAKKLRRHATFRSVKGRKSVLYRPTSGLVP